MNLYVLIGLPGAGKSTYSRTIKKADKIIISSDEIREKLFGTEFNDSIKAEVFKHLISESINCLKKGFDVIVDTTFLNEKLYRNIFIKEINEANVEVKTIAVIIERDIEECIARDKMRSSHRRVGRMVINKLNEQLVLPEQDEDFDLVMTVKN